MSTPQRVALMHAVQAEADRIATERAAAYPLRNLTTQEQVELLHMRADMLTTCLTDGDQIHATDLLTIAAELHLWLADVQRQIEEGF